MYHLRGVILALLIFVVFLVAPSVAKDLFGDVYRSLQPTPTPAFTCNGERKMLFTSQNLSDETLIGDRPLYPMEKVEVLEKYQDGYKVVFCEDNFVLFLGKGFLVGK